MIKTLTLFVLLLLSSCMTVNEGMLRKVNIPELPKKHVLVELKSGELIQKLNGAGQNEGVLSGTTVLNALGTSIMERWKSKGIISEYKEPGSLERDPDYTVTLSGVRNEDGSIGGAIISGLTLMLIPTTATLTYELDIDIVNNHNKKHATVRAKNAVTTWMQILLFPALPFSWIGSNNMINDIADYSYDELNKKAIFVE